MINSSLFDLIKTLTKAEKRYINFYKLNNPGKGGKTYLQLFERICKYDDRVETSKFLEALPFDKKKLNNIQNYLYRLILTGLRNFHSEGSVRIMVKNMLIDAEILLKRGLITQSLRKLDQVQTIAEKYLLRDVLIEVGMHKQAVLAQTDLLYHTNPGFKNSEIIKSVELQKSAVSDLKNEIIYRELFINYFSDNSKFATKQKAAAHLRQLLKNPLLHVREESLTMEAWSSLLGLKNLAYFFAGNYIGGIKYAREHLNVMETKYLHITKESPVDWAALVYNYLGFCFYQKQYDKVIECLDRIRHILTFSKRAAGKLSEARLWFNYYLYSLVINARVVNFGNLAQVVIGINDYYARYKNFIREEFPVTLNFLLAYNYFIKGEYKHAVYWLNKNFTDTNDNVRPDFQLHSRALYFIVQVDRKNTDLYRSARDNFIEYLEERSIAGKFESAIRRLMEDILFQAGSKEQSDKCFQKFKDQLVRLKGDEAEEKKMEHYFDYGTWIGTSC